MKSPTVACSEVLQSCPEYYTIYANIYYGDKTGKHVIISHDDEEIELS